MASVAIGSGEQYNYDIVRKFTIMALIWGAVGMLVGVTIASHGRF
jgi:cytochrome c oxidase cbb3-type subunit 1